MLTGVSVDRFGGLNTTTDSTDLGWDGAVEASNVEFEPGLVRVRDGLVRVGDADVISGTTVAGLLPVTYNSGLTRKMLVASIDASNTYLDLVSSDGTEAAVGNWAATPVRAGMVTIGTATSTLTFIATEATLRKYDGTTLGTSVGSPRFVAITPSSNRLVQGYFAAAADSPTGANGSESTVFFSNAGEPETFGATNYVTLTPGDGERIRGMVSWRGFVFVFKETRCFVFYGESTDSTGGVVFNYRVIPCPRLHTPTPASPTNDVLPVVAASRRGVYAWTADGLYVSSGGDFVKVSQPLDTTFRALSSSAAFKGLSCAADKVFFTATDGADVVYVFDELNGEWCTWSLAGGADLSPFVEWPQAFPYGRVVCYGGGTALYRTSPTATTDNGTIITASYQSGWRVPGGPGVEVAVRETELVGTGAPQFSWARDFGSFDTASTVTLGTSPAVARGRHRVGKAGENLAFKISSSSGAWSVRRVAPLMREQRRVGNET